MLAVLPSFTGTDVRPVAGSTVMTNDVAFDGTNFVAVWHQYNPSSASNLVSVPIDPRGTAGSQTVMPLDKGEWVGTPLVAAGAGVPALFGYQDRHSAYDGAHQTMLLFASELGGEATTTPFAPEIICATENGDGTVTVRWRPVPNALGVSIELQLADGTFRPIGVASADATIARASLAGLPHGAIRVRAWNAAGLSPASPLAPSVPPPMAILRSTMRACAGAPLTVDVTLRGSAPFTIRWSDGMVQSNVMSSSTSRTVTATATTPALQRSTRYWVRVSNRCGSADSAAFAVIVPATKGRAVRH